MDERRAVAALLRSIGALMSGWTHQEIEAGCRPHHHRWPDVRDHVPPQPGLGARIDDAYSLKYASSPYLPAMVGARASIAIVQINPLRRE